MAFLGSDVLDLGIKKVGQEYVLGATVPLDNPLWVGPWDCAEFTSWAAYLAYGLIFGAGTKSGLSKAQPYSGHWYAEALKRGTPISWQQALNIPGAVLIRAPSSSGIGHVAFAMGDGDQTLEARSKNYGVGVFKAARERAWSIGCLLPGVDYQMDIAAPREARPSVFPRGHLSFKRPPTRSLDVLALQRSLGAAGVDSGPLDGFFGRQTEAAVAAFQALRGIEVDGVFGPNTAKALGVAFPIVPTNEDVTLFTSDARISKVSVPVPDARSGSVDVVVDVILSGKHYKATCASGFSFLVGSSTTYTDDMHRTGLFQGKSTIKDIAKFGSYSATEHVTVFGQWAHFIGPTLLAEGGGRFATLNTYDRAAFTFGAPQLAAHTPNSNFVEYLRELLRLNEASVHFPELSLRKRTDGRETIHLEDGAGHVDLEEVVVVKRPNGKTEEQLAKLMEFLNPTPTAIDPQELSASARLMNWLRLDPKTKELQIEIFISQAKKNLARARTKVDGLSDQEWPIKLWVMDCLHHGRGTFSQMTAALKASNPEEQFRRIGSPSFDGRIAAVNAAIAELKKSGELDGFSPE